MTCKSARERESKREKDCQSADEVKMTWIETGLVIYLKTDDDYDDDDDAALFILVWSAIHGGGVGGVVVLVV